VQGCPTLSPNELKFALSKLNGRHALRNLALVTLGVQSDLRISELLSLKVGQVWDSKKTVSRFYVSRQATKGKHAGACIVLHPDAARALTRWLHQLTSNQPAWVNAARNIVWVLSEV